MGNSISSGKVVAKAGSAPTEGNSLPSARKDKPSTTRQKNARIDARASLEILNSAVNLCMNAGLSVTYSNQQGRLCLYVAGAYCDPNAPGTIFLPVLAEGKQNG